jgi:hypothetical protein
MTPEQIKDAADRAEGIKMARCDFGEMEHLTLAGARGMLAVTAVPYLRGERAYRDWFVTEALIPLLAHAYPDLSVVGIETEKRLNGCDLRIDVLARMDDRRSVGFELKAVNSKNPQTARYRLMQGVGQALLYHDVLSAHGPADVFLVGDVLHPEVLAVCVRHGLPIGVAEANSERIVCALGSRRLAQ